MDKVFLDGNLGQVGKYDIAFKEGKLVVEIDANVPIGTAGMVIKLDASNVLDALALAIPGKIDDAVIGIIKSALLA